MTVLTILHKKRLFRPLILLFASASSCWAQSSDVESLMLIETVAGNTYQRSAYDAEGELTDRSILRIGSLITEQDGRVTVTIDVDSFTDSGEQERTRQVSWSCDPNAISMFMNILILAGGDFKRKMRLEVSGPPMLYPDSVNANSEFEDVTLNLQVREGFLSLLGTKTRLVISNRRVQEMDSSEPGSYTVESELKVKVYVMGIPVKHRRFRSIETVRKGAGLVYQRLVFPNGQTMTIEQLDGGVAELAEMRSILHEDLPIFQRENRALR